MDKYKIVLTGGGSGGHVFPLVAVTREMKRIMPSGLDLYFIGPKDRWVEMYLSEEDVQMKYVQTGKIRRYLTFKSVVSNVVDGFKVVVGLFQSLFILFFLNPDLVFSKGGAGSVPVVLTARLLSIPIFNHESDSVPGLANKVGSRLANQTFITFADTEYLNPRKTIMTGHPIRRELFGGSAEEATRIFNLTGERPILFIFAGSQGSERINDLILLTLPQLLTRFEIIHQCGSENYGAVRGESATVVEEGTEKFYHLMPFLNEVQTREALFVSDLVVMRAGAGSISEAANLRKPAVLIPLPESAQDHQRENAYRLGSMGAAVVLEENILKPQFFVNKLIYLIEHQEDLDELSENIKKFSKPEAAKTIAHYLLEYLMS